MCAAAVHGGLYVGIAAEQLKPALLCLAEKCRHFHFHRDVSGGSGVGLAVPVRSALVSGLQYPWRAFVQMGGVQY